MACPRRSVGACSGHTDRGRSVLPEGGGQDSRGGWSSAYSGLPNRVNGLSHQYIGRRRGRRGHFSRTECIVQGCQCQRQLGLLLLVPLLAAGCSESDPPPPVAPPAPSVEVGREFDPVTAGVIRGQVIWRGEVPETSLIKARIHPFDGSGGIEFVGENPNTPRIDQKTRGVQNAVLFLRGVDPSGSRPWDHPPVRVE